MTATQDRTRNVKRFPSGDPFAGGDSPRGRLMRGVAAQLRLAAAMNPPGALPGTVSVSVAQMVKLAMVLEGGAA